MRPVTRPNSEIANALHREHARPNQMRQPRALLGIEHRMNLLQRAKQRFAQTLVAFDPSIPRGGRPGGIERIAGQGIGKLAQRSSIVDGSLRALCLELIENTRQQDHLLVVQLELMSQEAQGSAHTKSATRAKTFVA